MKKLLGSVLALAFVFVSSQAKAEPFKNLKFGGSVEMNATSARNVLDFQTVAHDRIGAMQTRVAVHMDWDLLDDVHSRITLGKYNRVWGQPGAGANSTNSETAQEVQTNVLVHEAFLKIDKLFGYVDSSFGRQFYGEEGDLIVYYGPKSNLYGMDTTSVDAAKFDWSNDKMFAQAFVGRPNNAVNAIANSGNALHGQQDVRGFVVGNKGNENIDGKVYVWNQATHRSQSGIWGADDSKNDNLYIAGLKVKGKVGGAYGSAEYAKNFGENRSGTGHYAGWALLVNGGMKAEVASIGTFNPWAEFGYGSGASQTTRRNNAFVAVASDYRPGAIYGRFGTGAALTMYNGANNVASNSLSNRVLWGLGVKATPSALNKLTVGAAYYDFRFQRLAANGADKGNKHIGYELDGIAEWKHSENVSLKGAIGTFQPGGYIKNLNVSNKPATMSALDICVKF